MDTRIRVQEIIPLTMATTDNVGSGIVCEKVIDISDDELMRLGQRFLELIARRCEE